MYIPRNPSNCILDFFGLIVRVGSLFIRYLRITSVLFFVCLFVSGLFLLQSYIHGALEDI